MTGLQIVTSASALLATFYYADALWRSDVRLSFTNALVWTVAVMIAVVSFVGYRGAF